MFTNLSASEVASYVFQTVARTIPASADSAEAAVIGDALYVRAVVPVRDIAGTGVLGPLAGLLNDRERLQLGGTFRVIRPGLSEFEVREIKLRDFKVPTGAIPRLVQQISHGNAARGSRAERAPRDDTALAGRRPDRERPRDALQDALGSGPVSRRILIVDDEQGIRAALGQLLEFEGYEVRTVANAVDGLAEYARFKPASRLHGREDGGHRRARGAAKAARSRIRRAIVVMISGHATIQTAVEATQHGAYDILEKPLDTDRILVTLRNALAHLDLHEENTRLRDVVRSKFEIVGTSYAIRAVTEKIERVGKTPARVLITGENGTGKELVARAIHSLSTRAKGAFVEVNCAAIPAELIESELFGHMKGSFTGAVADRAGKFEQAHGGTLFLDEIGDMSLAAQAKVLRVLQDGVVTRIGGSKPIQVDVRVLAATNKDVEAEIAGGTVPRGPVLPAQRRADPRAAAPRAARGHPAAHRALHRDSSRDRVASRPRHRR